MVRQWLSRVVALLLCGVILAGCADSSNTSSQTTRSNVAAQPAAAKETRTPTRPAARAQQSCDGFLFREAADEAGAACPDLPALSAAGVVVPDPPGKRGRVREVIDGDTLRVTFGNTEVRVRIFIADTPEMNPVECFGVDALVHTESLIPVGSIAWFEAGITETDRYGRSLYYVWFEQGAGRYRLLQDAIIRDGFGKVVIYPPDDKYEEWLRQGQADAERLGRGMWSVCGSSNLAAAPTATSAPVSIITTGPSQQQGISSNAGNCDPSYPTVCIPTVYVSGDLDCGDIPYRRFQVLRPDPHGFDRDRDGVGCES